VVGPLGFERSPQWRLIATPAYFYAATFSIFLLKYGTAREAGIRNPALSGDISRYPFFH
jgi:hypothetical protein